MIGNIDFKIGHLLISKLQTFLYAETGSLASNVYTFTCTINSDYYEYCWTLNETLFAVIGVHCNGTQYS